MCPEYQPGCEGDRAVAALSTPSGPMAGVGQGTVGGLPPRTQRTQTQPAGQLAAHRAGGSEALASGGLRGPSRCALHREEKEVPTEPQA